ncbi:hypothetical protein [Rhizobium sp. RU36D]|uniref:hypothetical protein n=1 Tax=Rhizobium sp. RU36D TaxID=1907415 RepID=UPI0009D7FB9D|nr:hypothetical protein [Rhizobium sp. RU36D]SMD13744.1 hypothetical protein SAMN05880593_12534 [Rhizobium sp. RU36D]
MPMNDDRMHDLFAEIRRIEATPSDALTARLLADARREADALAVARDTMAERPAVFSLRLAIEDLIGIIGGWRPALGMAASLCCGLWLGAAGIDPAMLLPGLERPTLTFDLPENPLALITAP